MTSKLDALLEIPRPKGNKNTSEVMHGEVIEQIDETLRNRGTLNAESIDSATLEGRCLMVLSKGAHLGAFRGLVCSYLLKNDGASPLPLVSLLARMLGAYWVDIEPSGLNRQRLRNAWLKHALSSLTEVLERHLTDFPDSDPALIAAIEAVVPVVQGLEIEWVGIAAFLLRAKRIIIQGTSGETRSIAPDSQLGATSGRASSSTAGHILTPRERAELRRDVISLAHRITADDPSVSLGYVMRRYATWMQFQNLPSTDEDQRIEQSSMPPSIKNEFEAMLSKPSQENLLRLEDRLVSSPLWLDGQYLAARMALDLQMPKVGESIRSALIEYLASTPGLSALKYKNGEPLLAPETLAWLSTDEEASSARPKSNELAPKDSQPVGNTSPGLDDELAAMQPAKGKKLDRRAKAVLKRDLAQSLIQHGYTQSAAILLEELRDVLADPILQAWDRTLADQIVVILKEAQRSAPN